MADALPPMSPSPTRDAPPWPSRVLRLWFGVSAPVKPAPYALSGLALMLLKYSVEALLIWHYTESFFAPWDFVNPVLSVRTELLRPAPPWLGWALFVWTLPFLWIALSMTVRRAADGGGSPWTGLFVLIPVVNLLVMVALCFCPSKPGNPWLPRSEASRLDARARSATLGIGAALLIGGVMLLASVYLFRTYGASLFLGTPLLMGSAAAYIHNREHSRSSAASIGVGIAAVGAGGLALLLFALEGAICIAMAAPLMVPIGALGGVIGKAIADATRRSGAGLMASVLALPLLGGVEALSIRGLSAGATSGGAEYVVLSAVEIDAPPEVVWRHVIDFPDLPRPEPWYFRLGIASPQRARIVGRGVGAIRHCEFSTGAFVEPITAWEAPHRLAFDVTEQPAPMFELSPYQHVHPPHLHGTLASQRGEFRLVALPGGRTRLEGRTWYSFEMFPQWYWTLWSDLLIHAIHLRVLEHVRGLATA